MDVSKTFEIFFQNLAVANIEQISSRYEEITRCLNRKYRGTECRVSNSLQVGSYGRWTAINGLSDLDMIYMIPDDIYQRFKNRPSALLQDIKSAITTRYTSTKIKGDGQVVVVDFNNGKIEVLPCIEREDGSFLHPDTNDGGAWKITNPRAEQNALRDLNKAKNGNLYRLCRMMRAWKDTFGVAISGILIDTLAYNFLDSVNDYDDRSTTYSDWLARDFFFYLSNLPKQERWLAPGSRQYVHCKNNFQRKAKKSYDICLDAIKSEDQKGVYKKWKLLFGRPFPDLSVKLEAAEEPAYTNTEEFIESYYPVNIQYDLEIDCKVSQQGFREYFLRIMLRDRMPLLAKKQLNFFVTSCNVPEPFEYKWKVLNRGDEAIRRDMIRGQIIDGESKGRKKEKTTFRGNHIVECYAIKNGVVVARDMIDVPISTNA